MKSCHFSWLYVSRRFRRTNGLFIAHSLASHKNANAFAIHGTVEDSRTCSRPWMKWKAVENENKTTATRMLTIMCNKFDSFVSICRIFCLYSPAAFNECHWVKSYCLETSPSTYPWRWNGNISIFFSSLWMFVLSKYHTIIYIKFWIFRAIFPSLNKPFC